MIEKSQNPNTHSTNLPSASTMVTVTVSGDVMLSGLAANTITLKVSFSSSISSPSIVIGWQIELPTGVDGGMVSI